MNAAEAFMIARAHTGQRPRLVSRKSGVPHVYCGRVTRSGRHVPFAGRPVCGQRTKQLSVHRRDGRAPHPLRPSIGTYLCRRCIASLRRWAARLVLPSTGPGPAAPRGYRAQQLPDLEALLGSLCAVSTHAELHAAERCLTLGTPDVPLELMHLRGVPFRGRIVQVPHLAHLARRAHPDAVCCPPAKTPGLMERPLGTIAEARRAQTERLGLTPSKRRY